MEFYAEISRKFLNDIEKNAKNINLPIGVQLNRKRGNRACFIVCDKNMRKDVMDCLDDQGISWQILEEN